MASKKPARDVEIVTLVGPTGTRIHVAADKVEKMKKLGFKEPEAPKPEPPKPSTRPTEK